MTSAPKELKLNRAYTWEDHDPVIDQMRTLKQTENLNDAKISELTGISKTTLDKWFNRSKKNNRKPTMKPMFSTVMSFTRGLGYDLQFVKPERKVSASTGVKFQRNIRAKSNLNNSSSASASP